MAAITRSFLNRYNQPTSVRLAESVHKRAALGTEAKVFLAHSSKDKEIVLGVAAMFMSQGIPVYVDWLDEGMPDPPNKATAHRLQHKILECSKFVVVQTPNSIGSKWIPWELGFADGPRKREDIAILPIVETEKDWDGNLFYGLYRVIGQYDGVLKAYVKPGEGDKLVDWLRKT